MQTVLKRRREQYRELREAGVLPVAYLCFDGVTTTLEDPQCGRFTRPKPGVPQVIGSGNAWRRQVWSTICARAGLFPDHHHQHHGYRVGAGQEGHSPMAGDSYNFCGTTTAARRRRRAELEAMQQARIRAAMDAHGNSIGAPMTRPQADTMRAILQEHGYSAGQTYQDARARRRHALEEMQQQRIRAAMDLGGQGNTMGVSVGQTARDARERWSRNRAEAQRQAWLREFQQEGMLAQGVSVAGQRPPGYNEKQRARRAALLRARRRAMQGR